MAELPSRWTVNSPRDYDVNAHTRPRTGLARTIGDEDRLPEAVGDVMKEATIALWRDLWGKVTSGTPQRVAELEAQVASLTERLAHERAITKRLGHRVEAQERELLAVRARRGQRKVKRVNGKVPDNPKIADADRAGWTQQGE